MMHKTRAAQKRILHEAYKWNKKKKERRAPLFVIPISKESPDWSHQTLLLYFAFIFLFCSKESYGGETLFGPDVSYFWDLSRTRSSPKKQAGGGWMFLWSNDDDCQLFL